MSGTGTARVYGPGERLSDRSRAVPGRLAGSLR